MGMVKRGSLQPGGLHKTPQDFDVLQQELLKLKNVHGLESGNDRKSILFAAMCPVEHTAFKLR